MNNKMETNKETIKEPRRILSKPLSVREQWALCDEDAYLEGVVSVTHAELAANDLNCAYSGDEVYWKVCDDLPKTTKLMVDGKALYIHRANFQIIDKALLQ